MILQKLVGVAIIVVAFTLLYLVSVFEPPTYVQILIAFAGSFICLVGIVVLFSEYPIEMKEVLRKSSPRVH